MTPDQNVPLPAGGPTRNPPREQTDETAPHTDRYAGLTLTDDRTMIYDRMQPNGWILSTLAFTVDEID